MHSTNLFFLEKKQTEIVEKKPEKVFLQFDYWVTVDLELRFGKLLHSITKKHNDDLFT